MDLVRLRMVQGGGEVLETWLYCDGCAVPDACRTTGKYQGLRSHVFPAGASGGGGSGAGGVVQLTHTQPPRKHRPRVLLLSATEGVLVRDGGEAWLVHRRLDGPWVPIRQLQESSLDMEPPLAKMLEGSRDG